MTDSSLTDLPQFLAKPTRFMFFTGKGGVGKTSIAGAAALSLADHGKSVLLVSTDPASNLDEILDVPLTNQPVAVPNAAGLSVLNIDPTAQRTPIACACWIRWTLAPVRVSAIGCVNSYRALVRLRSRHSTNL
ncbi:ArsA family ATPase [Sphingobium sp. TCM1]|uniref:ArsA family ATPase n=1 Tax=Sphingobium sp. TCM1 TaxID=453246 RepID=UPI003FA70E65